MYKHSFRNRIVSSSFSLPVMACITLLLWVLPDPGNWQQWAGLGMTGLITVLLTELSNRDSLLRVRSRMVSTAYLMLMTICPALHAWNLQMVTAFCFVVSYFVLFSSYQKIRGEGYIFHVFFFAGIGSLIYPPVLLTALGYYISMLFQFRNFTWRTFTAGIFGLIVPYSFYTVYALWQDNITTAFLYLKEWNIPVQPDFSVVSTQQWITAGTICFFALLAFIHFFHTAYNDKIRIRMLYYAMATQEVILAAGLVIFPHHFNEQFTLFLLNSSLFIAHYYALGKGRFFNGWFNISLFVLTALGLYNYITVL